MGQYEQDKKEASLYIKNLVNLLKSKKDISIAISKICIDFQEKWGFSKKTVLNMLSTYIEADIIEISNNEVFFKNNEAIKNE